MFEMRSAWHRGTYKIFIKARRPKGAAEISNVSRPKSTVWGANRVICVGCGYNKDYICSDKSI